MKLNTEKCKQLLETKQRDAKPLVSEQSYSPLGDVMTGSSHKAVKAVFDSCRNVPQSPININKLVDGIYKGVQGLGTDEGLILRSLSHIKDLNTFCTAAKNYKTTYGVDLYSDLDGDIDEETLWAQISRILRNLKPTAGILNPPYDGREWEFIEKNLKVLKKNSKCVAIVPMSLVTSMDAKNLNYRKRILENHQLEAVFSMPNELFFNSNTSVVTCVVVLTAHVKHSENKEVYFGYYKNDGFEKRKKFGRYDINNTWDKIENEEELSETEKDNLVIILKEFIFHFLVARIVE
jgi:hypothetical protein